MSVDKVPEGWQVWDHEPQDRLILAFMPDVFDGSRFPPACLPTIYVREGERDPRLAGPAPARGTEGTWTVTLFLEPDVSERIGTFGAWEVAIDGALEAAEAFASGEIDVRGFYQVPRADYLDKLEELVGPVE